MIRFVTDTQVEVVAVGQAQMLFLADLGIPEGAFRRLGLAQAAPFDRRFHVSLRLIAGPP